MILTGLSAIHVLVREKFVLVPPDGHMKTVARWTQPSFLFWTLCRQKATETLCDRGERQHPIMPREQAPVTYDELTPTTLPTAVLKPRTDPAKAAATTAVTAAAAMPGTAAPMAQAASAAPSNTPSPSLKVIVVGNQSVGKSSLVEMFVRSKYPEHYNPTSTWARNSVSMDNVRFDIWDFSGQESATKDEMRTTNYTGAAVALVCFSVNMPGSFRDLKDKVRSNECAVCSALAHTLFAFSCRPPYAHPVVSCCFVCLFKWAPEIERLCPDTPIVVVALQTDLRNERSTSQVRPGGCS